VLLRPVRINCRRSPKLRPPEFVPLLRNARGRIMEMPIIVWKRRSGTSS